jgi:hypothetical protein
MTEQATALTMTDTNWTARARSRYLDIEVTRATLAACPNTSYRLGKAGSMLALARNPGYRFELTREDIPAEVVALLETTVAEARATLRPFANRMRELQAESFAMDEIWNILDGEGATEHGLRYGASTFLLSL